MEIEKQVPNNTILLYEKIFLDSGNYKGNFRFCFTKEGDYFFQKNRLFEPKSSSNFDSNFNDEPMFSLHDNLIPQLNEEIQNVQTEKLNDVYGTSSMEKEIWTFYHDKVGASQIVVWSDNRPRELQNLKDKLDELLLESKK